MPRFQIAAPSPFTWFNWARDFAPTTTWPREQYMTWMNIRRPTITKLKSFYAFLWGNYILPGLAQALILARFRENLTQEQKREISTWARRTRSYMFPGHWVQFYDLGDQMMTPLRWRGEDLYKFYRTGEVQEVN
jgi:hypothetical protein